VIRAAWSAAIFCWALAAGGTLTVIAAAVYLK
jgi:hypothetical protein